MIYEGGNITIEVKRRKQTQRANSSLTPQCKESSQKAHFFCKYLFCLCPLCVAIFSSSLASTLTPNEDSWVINTAVSTQFLQNCQLNLKYQSLDSIPSHLHWWCPKFCLEFKSLLPWLRYFNCWGPI